MAYQRYSVKEAINRLFRLFSGNTPPSDVPNTLSAPVFSLDEAWSNFVELIAGSLPEETATLPPAISVGESNLPDATIAQKGIAELATNAEAVAGTDTERISTPAGVSAAIAALAGGAVEYGGLFNNSTGTAVVTLSTSWEKITGSYQGVMESSDDITPDADDCRIIVNHVGVLFCGIQASFSGGNNASIEGAVYVDGVRQETIRFRRKLGTGGDVGSASALGIINITGTPVDVEFFARADAGTPDFKLESGQIWVYGLPTS